jgi:diketogulonate reductase-like aldo/keto reductase
LHTDYIDLLLLHAPIKNEKYQKETFDAFIKLRKEGKVRNIGVSNFNIQELKAARSYIKLQTD